MKISDFRVISEAFKYIGDLIEDLERRIKYNEDHIKELDEEIANAENPSNWAKEDLQNSYERIEALKKIIEYLSKFKV